MIFGRQGTQRIARKERRKEQGTVNSKKIQTTTRAFYS